MKYSYNKQYIQEKSKLAFMALIATVAIVGSITMTNSSNAKELANGLPAPKPACTDVKSLSYRGDSRVGELGFASIDINYSVSPCDKTIPVRIQVTLTQNIAGAEPVYIDTDAALSGKFTVNGVLVGKSYIAKVTVINATTNEVVSSSQIFAAAVRKTGV